MRTNFKTELPEKFARNVLDLCGETGKQWLTDLPALIKEIEENWSLETYQPFLNLSYNYVASGICADGRAAVLKIALPLENPEIFNEAAFLRATDGNGAVKLLKLDVTRRAMLLEKLSPGENLKQIKLTDEARAIEIAIGIMRRIESKPPPDSPFRLLEDWFGNFFQKAATTNFPFQVQLKTREFYENLSSATKSKFLIHGDLHHENILSATREPFLAIDPKGIVGDIGYEIAVFLNNHLLWLAADPNRTEKLNDAVRRFSEAFEIEPNDLRKWAFAQIVLSAWWTFEENGENWQTDLALAEIWDV